MKRIVAIVLLAMAQPIMTQPALAEINGAGPVVASPEAAAANAKVHEDLRAMKDRLVAALNAKNIDALLADLHSQARVTTMDSQLSKGHEGVRAYYAKMMTGSSKLVEEMALKSQPDDLSILYADGKVAVTTGTAEAHFRLAGGKEMDVPLRWTATSVNTDGQWKVASAQFAANMFDNPVQNAAQGMLTYVGAGAGLLGLILGWLLGRRKRTA